MDGPELDHTIIVRKCTDRREVTILIPTKTTVTGIQDSGSKRMGDFAKDQSSQWKNSQLDQQNLNLWFYEKIQTQTQTCYRKKVKLKPKPKPAAEKKVKLKPKPKPATENKVKPEPKPKPRSKTCSNPNPLFHIQTHGFAHLWWGGLILGEDKTPP